jgi:hypothetical protein
MFESTDSLCQLCLCLAGQGKHENLVGASEVVPHQIVDFGNDCGGLASSGPSDDERSVLIGDYSPALLLGERVGLDRIEPGAILVQPCIDELGVLFVDGWYWFCEALREFTKRVTMFDWRCGDQPVEMWTRLALAVLINPVIDFGSRHEFTGGPRLSKFLESLPLDFPC